MRHLSVRRAAIGLALLPVSLLVAAACSRGGAGAAPSPVRSAGAAGGAMTALAAADQAAGWQLLFDGTTTNGWRGYQQQAMPAGWHVTDGLLAKDSSVDDIITTNDYGNFELELDWKIGPAGNSGIFYRGTEEYEHVYWSAPEYQLLDDAAAPDAKSRLTSAGSDYALYPSPAGFEHPAGEWNHTRIVVDGAHVEHWLNGHKLLEYTLWNADWKARVKASKFGEWANYGLSKRGHIAFQGDHNGTLAFRNIRIHELP